MMTFAAVMMLMGCVLNTNAESDDSVTCSFTVDNYVEKVWVDGVDVTSSVQGNLRSWPTKKTLIFDDTASSLALKGNDAEAGCVNGGFAIVCTSTNADSAWNMNSEDDRTSWLVSSASGGYATPSTDASGLEWYENGYSYDPSEFGVPRAGDTGYADGVVGYDDMCGTVSKESYWHFLLTLPGTPTGAPTSQPSIQPTIDCSALHIDHFLVDCSSEFDGHNNDIADLQSDVSSLTTLGADHSASINALESSVNALVNATTVISENEATIASLQEEIDLITEQLNKLGQYDAKTPLFSMDRMPESGDKNDGWNVVLTAKDLVLVALVCTTLVLVIALCVRSKGHSKYTAVSFVADSEVEKFAN